MAMPVILITGASGAVGGALCQALCSDFQVIGLDVKPCDQADEWIECDLTSADSLQLALHKLAESQGTQLAAVVHLAAYFDFTGEPHPLYSQLNVDGTRYLLDALQAFDVERFIYASTMLVHKAGVPGQKLTEDSPVEPGWVYPQSKAEAESVIRDAHDNIPVTLLRMAGLYDDESAVPTLSHQIARIYQREFKSYLYAGDSMAGQAFLHQEDMISLFRCVIEKRRQLPDFQILLAGEEEVMGYQALQNRIGHLLFGEQQWTTIELPQSLAKPGAWLEEAAEPVVPDAIDQGKKPFIRPFMIDLASDHYDLDISRSKSELGWQPKRRIYDGLKTLIQNLKASPVKWYERNGITIPDWMQGAKEKQVNADELRVKNEQDYQRTHYQFIWAHLLNMGLAFWLLTAPSVLGYQSQAMAYSDQVSGALLLVLGTLCLSWRFAAARWLAGAVGFWLLSAPLVFWAPTAAAYLNGTLVGMLVMGLAVCSRPTPGVTSIAAETGPNVPPGWDFNPSSWVQRLPIIVLAFVGFFISRYLCAYQLGHIDAVWDPFFSGAMGNGKNGTEEIITSSVSQAWPVPDAGLGALTYALEIITGIMGSVRRWRTMPWLVMLFGIMIVPLGAVSIFFIIIQPIVIGTWCTLCLIGAAAMLIQIPYSLDELVATTEFLYRRKKQGRPLLRIFFTGDTDDGDWQGDRTEFDRGAGTIVKDMLTGGVNLPWNLALCLPIGIWLMCTRVTLGSEGGMANSDHLIGALVLTITITALAETGRACRFALIPLGIALLITPFVYATDPLAMGASIVCGLALIALSVRLGPVDHSYGGWQRAIV